MRIKLTHLIGVSLISLTVAFSAINTSEGARSSSIFDSNTTGGGQNTTGGGWVVYNKKKPTEKPPTRRQKLLRCEKYWLDDVVECDEKFAFGSPCRSTYTENVCENKKNNCYKVSLNTNKRCKAKAIGVINTPPITSQNVPLAPKPPATTGNSKGGRLLYFDRFRNLTVIK